MQKPSPRPLSRHNSNKLYQSPVAWVQACCSLNKLRHASDRSLDRTNPPKLDACTDGVTSFRAAQSLLVQSLKDIRELKLVKCDNIISLSTPPIAASTISLENLIIRECHNLKCITTYEDDVQVDKNCCSIFPRLGNLEIEDCKELEFLFVSKLSCGLQKLKSLTIKEVPQLKYVVGSYQQDENHSSNQNQNEEVHFDLHDLEELKISNAPKINGICTKNYKMVLSSLQKIEIRNCQDKSSTDHNLTNWRTTEEINASTDSDRDPPFHIVQILLVQSLKTIREIELVECWNLISLSILTIAGSTMILENLTIRECHELKYITANEGVAEAGICPRLENLKIVNCKELEFLFVSTKSFGLKKLKSLTVKELPKLKYIVGNCQEEQHSLNHNQIDELHLNLPALETLKIKDARKINGICPKNYKLLLSSPLNVQICNCSINSFPAQEEHSSTNEGPRLFHAVQRLLIQSLKNIRKMELANCKSLISVSTLSIVSTILLEDLTIRACHRMKCIVAYEGDARTHMNYDSVFPKLKVLRVSDCDALEYLFPAYAFRSPLYLESLSIRKAPMLKYVFGRSQHEDILIHENQVIQAHIDFPALTNLFIRDVPQLVSIYPPNYYLRGLPLRSIALGGFPKFPVRPCNEILHFWHTKQQETKAIEMRLQTLKNLVVEASKIEVIFDLTHVDVEKNGDGLEPLTLQELELSNLSELVNLCVGPKRIMCFHSLQTLSINSCKKLKVIFSASMVRSLSMLTGLYISECEELVHIVEEDHETNADDHLCHEPCFPNLGQVHVELCDKLKYLFSVTLSGILPKLWYFNIKKAHELEHVLIRRAEMKEMVMKDVLPQLLGMELEELPNLISICHGIDFQTLADRKFGVNIKDCPNFSFYETSVTKRQTGPESVDSEAKEEAVEKLSSHQISNMGDAAQQSLTKVPVHSSPNLTVLPERDNTQARAKSFEEEEEEEQGGLITSRHPRSGMKASSSFSEEKLETSIDETKTTPDGSKNQDSEVWEGTYQKLSSHSNGIRALETQQSTTGSSNFTRSDELVGKAARNERRMIDAQHSTKGAQNFTKDELVDKEAKKETNMMEPKSQEEITRHDIQSHEEEKPEETTTMANGTEQKLSSHSNGRQASETQQSKADSSNFTTGTKEDAKEIVAQGIIFQRPKMTNLSSDSDVLGQSDELVGKEVQKETIMMELQSQQEMTGHDMQSHNEEERDGGLVTMQRHQSDVKAKRSLLKEKPETSIHNDVQVPNKSEALAIASSGSIAMKEESVFQNEPNTNVACHGDQANPSNLTHIERDSSHSRGGIVERHDSIKSDIEGTKLSASSFTTPREINPSCLPELQEIVDMMKLEDFERSIFVKALETRPQLRLSTEDRSTRVLCMSYRVLLDILNILTTRTPSTITEADKSLLGEHLKDAYLLGFDKDWIESIKAKVFDCDETYSIQEVLKGLENDLKSNEAMLEDIRYKELEAARMVQVAQQEHGNLMARHTNLLKAREDIIARRHQYWEIIAAKNRHFGF